ncbi:MAG TPA: hypothetical protein VNS63_22280, partial [Blastocatellia bacterium]|nr:hypothetical protein [Blastocatellia bacterium]
MTKSRITIFVLILLLFSNSAPAGSSHQKQDEPVRIGVNLVTLDVSVADKRRRPVPNLTAKDFTVIEDGVPQKIESFTSGVAPIRNDLKTRSNQKEHTAVPSGRQPAA